ncbi:hypothetical protein L484_011211 [Morus notabilis]|uniref:Uncharacterized protein n=1 Tax=Morus notabilis TaxID=981085 RepID=W9SIH6_9ROSA|nr:hypothetical protein L484_011211 [Morus notabilis]
MDSLSSDLTSEMLEHSLDGQVYARLVGSVGFDKESTKGILAFWNWLESCGYSKVVASISSLSDFMLCALAKEAIRCIKFLRRGILPLPYQSDDFQLLFSPVFINSGDFSFCFLREKYVERESALAKMDFLVKCVFKYAFSDIIVDQKVSTLKLPSLLEEEDQMGAQLSCSNVFRILSSYKEYPPPE